MYLFYIYVLTANCKVVYEIYYYYFNGAPIILVLNKRTAADNIVNTTWKKVGTTLRLRFNFIYSTYDYSLPICL